MIRVEQNPALMSELLKDLDEAVEEAAFEAASELQVRVSAGTRTGRHWPGDPRRASARGEYPQEQWGDLVKSVDNKRTGQAEQAVGFFDENQFKLNKLEFGLDSASDNQSTGTGDRKGQRRPLYMLFQGRDRDKTLKSMEEAIAAWSRRK